MAESRVAQGIFCRRLVFASVAIGVSTVCAFSAQAAETAAVQDQGGASTATEHAQTATVAAKEATQGDESAPEEEQASAEATEDESATESTSKETESTSEETEASTEETEALTDAEVAPDSETTAQQQTPSAAEVIDRWGEQEDAETARQNMRRKEQPLTRWSEVGGFFGMVSRPSGTNAIRYKVGSAYGGFFRPQILTFLGVRIFYREERIPVVVSPGGLDYGEDSYDIEWEHPKLKVTSLGLRIEPSYNPHPRLQILGVLGWAWVRSVAELPTAPGFDLKAKRAEVELNWSLGGGIGVDLINNWLNLSVVGTYGFITNQTGDADDAVQVVIDGQISHLAPLPRFKNPTDVLVSLSLVL